MTDTAASSGQRAADENAKRAVRLLNGGPEETPGTLAAATLQPCRAAPGPRARVSGAALGPDPRPRPRPRVLGSWAQPCCEAQAAGKPPYRSHASCRTRPVGDRAPPLPATRSQGRPCPRPDLSPGNSGPELLRNGAEHGSP